MDFFVDRLRDFDENIALLQDNGKSVSYKELAQYGEKVAPFVTTHSVAIILCKNTLGSVISYVSLLKNRVVPILLDAMIDRNLLDNLMHIYQPRYLCIPAENRDEFPLYTKVLEWEDYLLLENKDAEVYPVYEELAVLLTTSGSTGSPKFVRQSYRNIQANTDSICEYLELDENERAITTLPMNYTYGLSVLQSHMNVGATILLTDLPVVRKEFWDFAKREKVTSLVGVAYTYEMYLRAKLMTMDLPSLKTMTQAGGKLPYNRHKEFSEFAQRAGIRFVVMYGQTEATARMSYLPYDKSIEKCGSIGIPIPGGQFELRDDDGNLITDVDVDGELVYRGDNVTLGYAECAADLAKGDERHGVLKTGDIAKRDADGYYYITGRKKRFVKIYGSRVNLDEVEQLIRNQFPQIECACVGNDTKLILYINAENDVEECERYLAKTTHINLAAIKVMYIDEIPKNESGKILYKNLETDL
ncbi:MAG: AMP-binding protein [Roseburia sp.]|nr:AMP-binding protein [Roseburia sp.]